MSVKVTKFKLIIYTDDGGEHEHTLECATNDRSGITFEDIFAFHADTEFSRRAFRDTFEYVEEDNNVSENKIS